MRVWSCGRAGLWGEGVVARGCEVRAWWCGVLVWILELCSDLCF